jgi:hypothetical protein
MNAAKDVNVGQILERLGSDFDFCNKIIEVIKCMNTFETISGCKASKRFWKLGYDLTDIVWKITQEHPVKDPTLTLHEWLTTEKGYMDQFVQYQEKMNKQEAPELPPIKEITYNEWNEQFEIWMEANGP